MKTAYSYIRFSSKKQAKGDSVRRQLDWSDAIATKNGWHLDTEFRLQDLGISAFEGKNASTGNLAAFLKAVEGGLVAPGSVLLVESLDRLTRQQIEPAAMLFLSILTANVEIVTREPEMHYKSGDGFSKLIMAIVHMERAHNESVTKSMRAKAACAQRKALGKPNGRPPEWLKNPELVCQVFDLCLKGRGFLTIYRETGVPWATIGRMLRHPDARKIVGDDVFKAASAAIKGRLLARGPYGHKVANLFTGRVFLNTGDTMHITSTTRHKKLLCNHQGRSGFGKRSTFPYDVVEEAVLGAVRELAAPLPSVDTTAIEARIAEIDAKVAELQSEIISRNGAGVVSLLTPALAALEQQRKEAATKLEDANHQVVRESDVEAAHETDRLALRAACGRIISRIVIAIHDVGWERRATIQIILRSGRRKTVVAFWHRRTGESRLTNATNNPGVSDD